MAFGYPTARSQSPVRRNPKAQPYVAPEVLPEPVVDYAAQTNPDLHHDIVVFIVSSFACWHTAQEICKLILTEFGIRLVPHQTYKYDPERPAGRDLSEELLRLHKEAREEYRNRVSDVPIASKRYRLDQLQKLYDQEQALPCPNSKNLRQTIEQAAKEAADFYKRAFSVEHSGTVNTTTTPPVIQISFSDPRQLFDGTAEVIDIVPEPALLPATGE